MHDAKIYANFGTYKQFISREILPVYEELDPGVAPVPSLYFPFNERVSFM